MGHNGGQLPVVPGADRPAASGTADQGADMTDDYGKDPEAVARLTPEQYRVTQENGTEPPFRNEYWNNKEPGLYVDVVSGEPLFTSASKFDSHTGWPPFPPPLGPRVPRRAQGSRRPALLHQLRRPSLHPRR